VKLHSVILHEKAFADTIINKRRKKEGKRRVEPWISRACMRGEVMCATEAINGRRRKKGEKAKLALFNWKRAFRTDSLGSARERERKGEKEEKGRKGTIQTHRYKKLWAGGRYCPLPAQLHPGKGGGKGKKGLCLLGSGYPVDFYGLYCILEDY